MNEELSEIPVEVMYKFLLRDYRTLQDENKRLRQKIRMMLEDRIDEISVEHEKEIVSTMADYNMWSKSKLIAEVYRLIDELEHVRAQAHV